jgi:hypothetical protein
MTERDTRTRRKIRDAARRHELVVEDIEWAPIGVMQEMSGRSGGWTVWTDLGIVLFYSAAEAEEAFALHRLAYGARDV